MKYYIAMFRKDDLIDLYKFGSLYVYTQIVEYKESIEKLEMDCNFAENKFFAKCNPMDYSIEYYIVVLECASKPGKINISQVRKIYALDMDSYKIGLDLDRKLTISEPIWHEEYLKFQVKRYVDGAKAGAFIMNNIFGFENCDKLLKLNKKNDFLFEVYYDSYKSCNPEGKHCIWYYLLRYERHQNYLNDYGGYFLDMLHVYANYKKGMFIDADIKQHRTGKLIVESGCHNFGNLWKLIDAKGKDTVTTMKKDKVQSLIKVAPFFFLLKNEFKVGISNEVHYMGKYPLNEFVNIIKNTYKDSEMELRMAVQLVGYALGWDYTYKYSYTHDNNITIIQK